MTASLSAYSIANRNVVRFYLRNFPAYTGMTPDRLKIKYSQSHSRESGYDLKPPIFRRLIKKIKFLTMI
ncbi:MAG: hypothetical protein EVG15_04830 [Candidatus Acididesulfobacter diazotrophicus]|uniref:Uncharacterized protein n=1 Tax=Candidatus Acididesulfobacter diazotrophicus TaxID=2597226 RepID=A0A519BN61_9DELT|nr:MAG: hypothetical protein EVG15_04830 [Candidatus Acididesulfobacter diazotrophicus]